MKTAKKVLKNGCVYTVDEKESVAEAIAIGRDGNIMYVGDISGAMEFIGAETEVTDLEGKLILPGFVENHTHAGGSSLKYTQIYLAEVKTVPEYIDIIKRFANDKANEGVTFVTGANWEQAVFKEYNQQVYGLPSELDLGPSRFLLDEALKGTYLENVPVKIYSNDFHCGWYNSAAINCAQGIGFDINGKRTRDEGSDVITRVPEHISGEFHGTDFSAYRGEPWGTFREDAMYKYMDRLMPKVSPGRLNVDVRKGMHGFIREMHSYGITLIQDILITPLEDNPHVDYLYEAVINSEENIIWRISLFGDIEHPEQSAKEFRAVQKKYPGSAEFRFESVKIFADGVGKGMYMLEPFADDPENQDNVGCLYKNVSSDQLKLFIETMHKEDIPLHIHSMGDGTIKKCLDGFETAVEKYGRKDLRHTMTHLQFIRPEDIKRMKELGITASINPYWHYKEPFYFEELFVPLLGENRAENCFPAKSFFNNGVLTCAASDGSISEHPAPLWAIEISITRNMPGAVSRDRIHNLKEKISLPQAVKMCTVNGAKSVHMEALTGSLEVGKRADMIILDRNIFKIPENEIHTVNVLETIVNGKTVYKATYDEEC